MEKKKALEGRLIKAKRKLLICRCCYFKSFTLTYQKIVSRLQKLGWDGEGWTQVSNSDPTARSGHTLIYDSARKSIVMLEELSTAL